MFPNTLGRLDSIFFSILIFKLWAFSRLIDISSSITVLISNGAICIGICPLWILESYNKSLTIDVIRSMS